MVRILETLTGRRTEIVEVGNELAEIRELLAQALGAAAIVGRPGYSVVTADGTTATFALPFSVANKNYVFAFVDSDYQHPDEVTLSEDRLSITLGFTPPAGARVVLRCTTSEIELVEGVDSENVLIDGLGTLNTYIAQSEPQLQGYASRAAFEAATVPAPVMRWFVQQGKHTLAYVRDASGTAIESANGVKGSPDGEATPDHYGWNASLTTAEQTSACVTCLEAGHPVVRFLSGNTYLVDFVDAEITAPITVHIDGATIKGATYVPVGSENDPNVIRINGTTPARHSVRITGHGVIDATLRRDTPGEASGSGLLVRYSNGVNIDGGIFFNSGTSATSGFGDSGVVIEYCRRTVIDGCFFRGWNDHGVYGTGGAEGNSAQVSSDLIVTNCVFEQIGAGAVRAARDYRRITVTNNHVVNSSKIFVAAGGAANPDSGTIYNISNNTGIALFSAPIDIRYGRPQDGAVVSGNIIQGWATTTAMPAINIRGVSNVSCYGNVIVPGDLVQADSATSCTLGIYVTGGTNPLDDVFYDADNVQVYGNTITIFDRSGDVSPPDNNVAILDLTNTARIWGNRLTNGEGFDIETGDGVVGNPLVQRFSSDGVGFGGAYARAALEVAGEARVSRIENADQHIALGTISTIPSISSRSPVDNAKKLSFRSTTTLANDAPSSGELGFLFYTLDVLKLDIDVNRVEATVPIRVPSYLTAGLPAVGLSGAGSFSYVPDATNGATPVVNDGAAWRRIALQDTAYPTHSSEADASTVATNNLFQTPTGRVRIKRGGTVQEPLVYVDDFSHALDGDKWQAAIDAMTIRGGQIIAAPRLYSIARKLVVDGKAITVRGTYSHTSSRGSVLSFGNNADYYLSVQDADGMLLDGLVLFKSGVLGPVMKLEPATVADKNGNINMQNVFMAGGLHTLEVSNVLNFKAVTCRFVNTAENGKALFLDGREGPQNIDVPEFTNCAFSANGTGAVVIDIDGGVASSKFSSCAWLFGNIGMHIHDSAGLTTEGPSFVQVVSGGTENSQRGVVVEKAKDVRFTGFYASVDPGTDDTHSPFTFTTAFTNTAQIMGGTVRGGRKYGIDMQGGELRLNGAHVGNNGGADNTGIGLRLGAGMTAAVVSGNIIGNLPDGLARQDYAIENDFGTDAVIVGNDLGTNSTAAFLTGGTGTTIGMNRL